MSKEVLKESSQYPELLKAIPDPPARLFYKGEWKSDLFEHCLAVVGSRRMSSYGKRVVEQLVGEAAASGVTIVSGFMYGVDAAAHQAAVEANGRTIAVMPCGIERVHPAYQQTLYERIQETEGLIFSEWDGDVMPMTWSYPRRNRIVAGLCQATLVVEAAIESGSLITAEFAKKFGRTIFAVPGPITSDVSAGTAALLRQGAKIAASPQDILEFFGKQELRSKKAQAGVPKGAVEQKILEALRREPLQVDVLARSFHMSAADLGGTLSFMELQGFISQEGGKYYVN